VKRKRRSTGYIGSSFLRSLSLLTSASKLKIKRNVQMETTTTHSRLAKGLLALQIPLLQLPPNLFNTKSQLSYSRKSLQTRPKKSTGLSSEHSSLACVKMLVNFKHSGRSGKKSCIEMVLTPNLDGQLRRTTVCAHRLTRLERLVTRESTRRTMQMRISRNGFWCEIV